MKIKVTFAKPKAKVADNGNPNENFVKKRGEAHKAKQEKLSQMESKVASVYGSKAYKML